jgi:hypothetical protein
MHPSLSSPRGLNTHGSQRHSTSQHTTTTQYWYGVAQATVCGTAAWRTLGAQARGTRATATRTTCAHWAGGRVGCLLPGPVHPRACAPWPLQMRLSARAPVRELHLSLSPAEAVGRSNPRISHRPLPCLACARRLQYQRRPWAKHQLHRQPLREWGHGAASCGKHMATRHMQQLTCLGAPHYSCTDMRWSCLCSVCAHVVAFMQPQLCCRYAILDSALHTHPVLAAPQAGNTLGQKSDIADGSLRREWEFRTFDNLVG